MLSRASSNSAVKRSCFSANEANANTTPSLCTMVPEGRIAHPAVLVNLNPNHPKGYKDYFAALHQTFHQYHATNLRIFDENSIISTRPLVCFRSIINAPAADVSAGQTLIKSTTAPRSLHNATNIRSTIQQSLDAADEAIQKALKEDAGLQGLHDMIPSTLEEQHSVLPSNSATVHVNIEKSKTTFPDKNSHILTSRNTPDPNTPKLAQNAILSLSDSSKNATQTVSPKLKPVQAPGADDNSVNVSNTIGRFTGQSRSEMVLRRLNNTKNNHLDEDLKADEGPSFLYSKVQLLNNMFSPNTDRAAIKSVDPLFMKDGGVELFSHRNTDGKQWNGSQTGGQDIQKYGVCRIYKACRLPDSTLLLPQWLSNHTDTISKYCDLRKPEFISDEYFSRIYHRLLNTSENRNSLQRILDYAGWTGRPNFELDVDLIGTRTFRTQEQHFTTDFFHDGIYALDAVLSYSATNESTFRRERVLNASSGIHENNSTYEPAIRPAFVLHDEVQGHGPSSRYIREMIGMVPPRSQRKNRVLFTSRLSGTGWRGSTCFRSIVLTRDTYPPHAVLKKKEKNVFFEYNRLNRDDVDEHEGNQTGRTGKGKECVIRVTILEPKPDKGKRARREGIMNEAEIVAHIKASAKNIGEQGEGGKMRVIVKKFYHEGRNVWHALRVVQNSEIVIGKNNAAMTSIMFARPRTGVIEVQPFSYSTGPFRSFARSLNLNYESVMAQPDMLSFEKCVMERYNKDWGEGVSEGEKEARMNGLLRLFREASDSFDGTKSRLDLSSLIGKDGIMRRGYIPRERVCAREQSLKVDAVKVGKQVMKIASGICKHRQAR